MAESSVTERETIAPTPGLEASYRSLEIAGGIFAILGILGIVFPT